LLTEVLPLHFCPANMQMMRAITLVALSSVLGEELDFACEDHSSLLQAKIAKHGAQPGTASNLVLKSVTDVAKSLTRSSSITMTPEAVQAAISAAVAAVATMRPALVAEHDFAQGQVNRQFDEIEACRDHTTRGVLSTTQHAADLETQSESLAQCNEDNNDAQHEQSTAQSNWDQLVAILVDSQPGRLTATNFHSSFTTWKQWIETEEPNIEASLATLNAATIAAEAKTEQCASATVDYNEVFCQHRLSCAMLGACQAHETQIYRELMADFSQSMDSRQDQSATIDQVDCLLQLVSAAVETNNTLSADALEECQPATGNNPDLVITFPPVPDALECPAAATDDPDCPGLVDVDEISDWEAGEVSSSQMEESEALGEPVEFDYAGSTCSAWAPLWRGGESCYFASTQLHFDQWWSHEGVNGYWQVVTQNPEDFVKFSMRVTRGPAFAIKYSDDGAAWSTAAEVPTSTVNSEVEWPSIGAHRYWRYEILGDWQSGPWYQDLQFYTARTR